MSQVSSLLSPSPVPMPVTVTVTVFSCHSQEMPVPIVALYGSLNALLNIALAARVSGQRGKDRVSLGVGQSSVLEVAVRTHANNAEFVPLALLMLLIAELSGGASLWLHIGGGALFIGRILHAIGMPRPAPNFGRFVGTTLTWVTIAATAIWVLVLRFRG